MNLKSSTTYLVGILLCSFLIILSCTPGEDERSSTAFHVPVDYYSLENGLKIVLSPDHSVPTVIVSVYYNIGFRIEPRGRTGFAHLFEHMMFQGSKNLGKMEFIRLVQENGGVLNGSTRFDYTNYFEIMPSHKLETMLWAEADRMRGLDITQENLTNQQGVVANEVKVNVLNQPYGGFPWLDMPQYANENWYNAHNFYGDLADLEAATLEDVQSFFNTFYAPNNAVLVITGDFNPDETKPLIEKYFGNIPSADVPPIPDISEPRQNKEKIFEKEDPLASNPALAIAYHVPGKNTPEYYAMGLLDQILVQGDNSLLFQHLVQEKGYSGNISGGINYALGNMFNYNGPMIWMINLIYDENNTSEEIIKSYDEILENLKSEGGITQEMLDMAIVKMRSSFFDEMSSMVGFGLSDLLASFALFDDAPENINNIEEQFRKVTPELINATLEEYLRPTNRTILTIKPASK